MLWCFEWKSDATLRILGVLRFRDCFFNPSPTVRLGTNNHSEPEDCFASFYKEELNVFLSFIILKKSETIL